MFRIYKFKSKYEVCGWMEADNGMKTVDHFMVCYVYAFMPVHNVLSCMVLYLYGVIAHVFEFYL